MDSAVDVVVVGSLNADLVAYAARLPTAGETVHGDSFTRQPGGKGLNQAVAAARSGATTRLIGCVGDDDLGRFLLDQATAGGVDVRGVGTEPTASGVALIEVDRAGTNRIVVVAGANGRLDRPRVTAGLGELPGTPAALLCQLETPLEGVAEALRYARRTGAIGVLNPAPAAVLPADLLADIDWLIPNEHEAALLLGEPVPLDDAAAALVVARRLQALGPRGVVVTLGARGAVAIDPGGTEHLLTAVPVDVVDTTGAGDAFCGSFTAGLAAGLPVPAALRRASAAGALSTTRSGAVPAIPFAAEVDALLSAS